MKVSSHSFTLIFHVLAGLGLAGCTLDHSADSVDLEFRAQGNPFLTAASMLEVADDAQPWGPGSFEPLVDPVELNDMVCCQNGNSAEIIKATSCMGAGDIALPVGMCIIECCELPDSRQRLGGADCLAAGGRGVPDDWCSTCTGENAGMEVWTLCPGLDYAGAGVCNPNGSDCSDVHDGTVIGTDLGCDTDITGCRICPEGTLAADLDGDGCEELCDCVNDPGPLP